MKVLIINNGSNPLPAVKGGGVETLIQYMLNANAQHDLTVVSAYDKNAEIESKSYKRVKFIYINFNSLFYKFLRAFFFIFNHYIGIDIGNALIYMTIKKVNLSDFDLIISENGVRLGKSIRKYYNGKLVLHLHNDWLNKNTKFGVSYKASFDEIWVISHYLKMRVEAIQGKTKVKILYNGVDTNLFTRMQQPLRNKYRANFNITDNDILIGFCGRIVEEKGVLHLIRAFKRYKIESAKNNLKLLIIGDCSGKSSYIKDIKKEVNEDIILSGYINHNELPVLMGIVDIAIAPTIHLEKYFSGNDYKGVVECFNLTVIEFLSLGIPVIISNSGGMPEILYSHFSNCIITAREHEFYDSFYRVLTYLIDIYDKAEIKCWAEEIASNFSINNYISTYFKYMSRLCCESV